MLEYSEKVLNNYENTNYTHYAANHSTKAGFAFFDKHVQLIKDLCGASAHQRNYWVTQISFYCKWQAESFWKWLGLTQ